MRRTRSQPSNARTQGAARGAKFDSRLLSSNARVHRRPMKAETRAPDLVPLPQGGLQMEWHDPNLDVEITIKEPGFASVWIVSPTHPDGKEISCRYDFSSGLEPIQQLSEEA